MELKEELQKYRRALSEAWDSKTETPKSKKGMWNSWTLAELKAELKKLKDTKKKTEALKTREKQVMFAIRAKQKNKWGKIKESSQAQITEGDSNNRGAEESGDADAYYGRPRKPNKRVNGKEITDLTDQEIEEYNRAYKEESSGRKDWGEPEEINPFRKRKQNQYAESIDFEQSQTEHLSDNKCDGCGATKESCTCPCSTCKGEGQCDGQECMECAGLGWGGSRSNVQESKEKKSTSSSKSKDSTESKKRKPGPFAKKKTK